MRPEGLLLVVVGTWVLAQLFGGNALQRLNIVKPSTSTGSLTLPDLSTVPPQLTPYLPGGPKNPLLPTI